MSLVSYAKFYQQIYEVPLSDRPNDHVIEDDDAIDRWWDNYVKEAMRKAAKTPSVGPAAMAAIPQYNA